MDCLKKRSFTQAVAILAGSAALYILLGRPFGRNVIFSGNGLIQQMNTSVDPCKDFYQFACGGFLAKYPPQDDFSRRSDFQTAIQLEELGINRLVLNYTENEDDIKPIIEMKRFFKTCLDKEKIEDEVTSLKNILNEIGGWQLLQPEVWKAADLDWVKAAAEIRRSTNNSAIISLDLASNGSNLALQVKKPSFGLPVEILTNSFINSRAMQTYKIFIYSVAKQLGSALDENELFEAIQDILDFEIRLAKSVKEYDRISMGRRLEIMSGQGERGILVNKFIEAITNPYGFDIGNKKIWIRGGAYWQDILRILRQEKKETIANYIGWRFISGLISETTPSFYKMKRKFDADLDGKTKAFPAAEERQNIRLRNTKDSFRRALRWKYMEEEVDTDAKNELGSMAKMIVETFKKILDEAELDSEAKNVLIANIDGIKMITFEEKETIEKYYEGLELGENYLENQVRISRFQFEKQIFGLIRGDENLPILYERGAVYSRLLNAISISPGLLQPPFFKGRYPRHQNYARLGFNIAHEIAHSLHITAAAAPISDFAKKKFTEKVKCFAKRFGEFHTAQGLHLNGELTSSENIADMEGLRVSWRAYQEYTSKFGPEAGLLGMEQFSIEQLFFIGYANGHCESITLEALANQIKTDSHSPAEFRVNGILKQFGEFAKAFNCPIDVNGMNPPAEDAPIGEIIYELVFL